MKKPTVEQYQGCLVGCAVGDAVGAPVESLDEGSAQAYVQHHLEPRRFDGLQVHGKYPFGQYTDDTQLTRELAFSLLKHQGINPEDFAERISTLFKNREIVGSGGSTRKAAARLAAKCPWNKSGEPHPAAGNGSAMRAAPIALAYQSCDLGDLKNAAAAQGVITHKSNLASTGAFAFALAVKKALEPRNVDDNVFLRTLINATEGLHKDFCEPLKGVAGIYERLLSKGEVLDDEVLRYIRGTQKNDPRNWDGISPYVVPSVLWSIHCFLAHPDNFWDAISLAIGAGGDTDTTGAMTGALCGARLGIEGIPHEVAVRVEDRGKYGYKFLCEIGRQLHEAFV